MSEAHDDDDAKAEPPTSSGGGILTFLGFVAFVVLVCVPLGFASQRFLRGIQVVSAIRTLAADEAGKGGKQVVVRGKVAGVATNGPMRPGAAGWIGEVGRWERRGKSSTYIVECTVTRIDGMTVQTSDALLALTGFDGHAPTVAHGLAVDRGAVAVDLLTEPSFAGIVSDDAMSVCNLPRGKASYTYNERVVHVGDDVVVRGCRDGEKVRACGDGVDLVTARATIDVVHDTKDEVGTTLLVATLLSLLALGVLGLVGGVNLVGRKSERKEISP
ncbi:MAG: hypothetical protein JST00_09485 [Deltaproteobacteria bacterium]|nr:hypothetical protein [Deltaproteobacteria bacterium]